VLQQQFFGKRNHENTVRCSDAMHIMAPIKAGTLSVVCVRNKNPNDAGEGGRKAR